MGKNSKTTSHSAETPSKPKRGLSFRNLFDQPIFHRTIGRGVPPRASMRSEGDLRSNKHSSDAADSVGRTIGSESLSKVPRSTAASVLGVGSSDKSHSGADLALECPLCLQVLPDDCFPHLLNCNHRSCRDCLRQYLKIEIMESRINLTCPECDTPLHPTDIQIITDDVALLQKYEEFMLRRVLVADPDVRWCPAPDCGYAVVATGCASCPKIVCQRPSCGTKFCYHCKQLWHPNKTCDASRAERALLAQSLSFSTVDATSANSGMAGEMKSCPRCGAFIVKMDDGSCNHMVCAICGAEFCWLCLKEISDLHYLSPSGCTFWGKKPWSRKKKILWQLGMLVGAPVVIALIAGVAVPAIIIGVPIWVGRKLYHKHRNKGKHKRNALIVAGVSGTILVSPLLAAAAVSLGVPVMLAYVYGVVPISLCRSEGCGGSDEGQGEGVNGEDEVPEAVVVTTPHPGVKEADTQADESSIGTAGPSLYNQPVEHGHVGDPGGDRESTSTRAVACYSLCDDHSIAANRIEVHADVAPMQQTCHADSKMSLPSPDPTAAGSQARDLTGAASGGVEDASCDQLAAIGGGRLYRPIVRKHSALVTPATVNGAQSVQFDESDLVFEANVERRRSWFTRHSLSVGDQLHKQVTSPRRPRGTDGSFGCVSEKSSVGGVLSYDDHLHQFGADARVVMTTSSIASPDDESNASLTLPFYGDCDRAVESDGTNVLGTDNPQFTTLPEPDEGSKITRGTSRDSDVATSVREIHAEISSRKSR